MADLFNPGARQRVEFAQRMSQTALGATLVRRTRPWVVIARTRRETSIDLTLRHGQRQFRISVPICMSGPCLADVGLSFAAPAPTQRGLFGGSRG